MGNDVALLKEMVTHTLNDLHPKVSKRRPSLRAEPLVPIFSQLPLTPSLHLGITHL